MLDPYHLLYSTTSLGYNVHFICTYNGLDMQQVNVTEFRQHLPDYLKRVHQGEVLQITSRGKVIARLVPEPDEVDAAIQRLTRLQGTVINGDIISPIENVEWTADADNL